MDAILMTPVIAGDGLFYKFGNAEISSARSIGSALQCASYTTSVMEDHLVFHSNDATNPDPVILTKFTWHRSLLPGSILVAGFRNGMLQSACIKPASLIETIMYTRIYNNSDRMPMAAVAH